jgi:hypothetical protein
VTFRKLNKYSNTAQKAHYGLGFHSARTYRYLCTIHGFAGKIVGK